MPTPRARAALLLSSVVLLSLNSRAPFGQPGPLAPLAGWDGAVVGMLGVLPPLGMAVSAGLVPWLLRRVSADRLLLWSTVTALLGAAIRPWGTGGLVAGTLVAALAIGGGNVLIPVLIRTRYSSRDSGRMFGVYGAMMGVGSAVIAGSAVPVATATGSWEAAIATAVLPAAAAVVGAAWVRVHGGEHAGVGAPPGDGDDAEVAVPGALGHPHGAAAGRAPSARSRTPVWRSAAGWSALLFFGVQSVLFYALLAWLPSVLIAAGLTAAQAGTGQSILIAGVALGGGLAPIHAGRRRSQLGTMLAIAVTSLLGILVILTVPSAPLLLGLGVPLLGIGLGGGQALPALIYSRRGRDAGHTAALSSFAQTGGFALAAVGAPLVGAVHAASGSWTPVLWLLIGVCCASPILGWRAARPDAHR
ncbi:MFS transporter [Mycetocola reblochoni]|uniref:Cyanate MFS transporter n=2 Tax=Mycetocola reblochoni TaxID=331618 RepID=A0A1R4K7H6_9MICO|nr:MFS transporter [Mycetocola reblochoni]RLP68198.1 MFS transporter [Mycetocola reblochoni]SJN40249.1 Cyanate MFS transporter [Mycetocola reblochoni REB411]